MRFFRFNRRLKKHEYFIYGLSLLLVVLAILVLPKKLKITEVECFTQYGPCSDKYLNLADELLGRPILYPLPKSTVQEVLRGFTEVNSFELRRRLPNTAVLLLSLKKSLGSAGSEVLGTSIAVDEQGQPLTLPTDPNQPILYIDDWKPNQNLKPNEVLALKALNSISKFTSSQITGKVDNLVLTAKFQNGPEILIDISKNEKKWLSSLQSLLERSKMSSKPIKRIDVRFNSPIIMYQ